MALTLNGWRIWPAKKNRPDSERTYEAIIHIGGPKTGSSALQSFLLNNRKQLARAGFYYPKHAIDKNSVSGGHSTLGINLRDQNIDATRKAFTQYLSEARRSGLVLLLSAESLFNHPHRLKSAIPDYRVKIIAFYRDPLDAIYSHYNQAVKRSFITQTFSQFCGPMAYNLEKHPMSGTILNEWADAFGKDAVQVETYQQPIDDQTSIERIFLRLLGINEDDQHTFSFPDARINVSYTAAALELRRLLNFVLKEQDEKVSSEIDHCLQAYSDRRHEPSPPLETLLDDKLYRDLRKVIDRTKRLVKRNYITDREPSPEQDQAPSTQMASPVPFHRTTLEEVLADAFEGHGKLLSLIRQRVKARLVANDSSPYPIVRLAEVLGMPDTQHMVTEQLFDRRQMQILTSDDSKAADLLKVVALTLERRGLLEDAYAVISRALSLRPKGPQIIEIHDRLAKRLSQEPC